MGADSRESPETREWRVDSLHENTAAVEEDGQLVHVPRWMLPAGAKENDIVRVTVEAGGEGSVSAETRLVMRIDAKATRAAMEASRRQVASTPPQNDPGGPIQL